MKIKELIESLNEFETTDEVEIVKTKIVIGRDSQVVGTIETRTKEITG